MEGQRKAEAVGQSSRNHIPPSRFKIYLAGPIAGLTYAQSEDWRDRVKAMLPPEIVCYSPLRGKQALRDLGRISVEAYDSKTLPLASDRGILRRDHYDVLSCDLLFCNLLGAATKASIGTAMELAWAYDHNIPIVLVDSPGSLHDHPMIREVYSYRVETLEEGVALAKAVLLP